MKLTVYSERIDQLQLWIRYLKTFLLMSSVINMVAIMVIFNQVGRERIVIVPPNLDKSIWIQSENISASYIEQMSYFLMNLVLNVTPQTAQYQADLFLKYVAPNQYTDLKSRIEGHLKKIGDQNVVLHFSPSGIEIDAPAMQAKVTGQLTLFIKGREIAKIQKIYDLKFKMINGRITLTEFLHSTSSIESKDSQLKKNGAGNVFY